MQTEEIKQAIGYQAAQLVEDGMLVGLGTGSTATYFIDSLIRRVQGGLTLSAVSSSLRSAQQAQAGGIPIVDINTITTIDLTIDGADEVDPCNRLIKGGGGALVREKIVACSSHKIVIIVDEHKLVNQLGAFGVPIEILAFGFSTTVHRLEKLGYQGTLRKKNNSIYVTDNGNYIYDIRHPSYFAHPEEDHWKILSVVGVVDTGFFFNLPVEVLVGYADGTTAFRRGT